MIPAFASTEIFICEKDVAAKTPTQITLLRKKVCVPIIHPIKNLFQI
ncbi:MAG: hypothetical protein J6A06_03305 [Fibrobacteraceae bacterium]|nr:hypothetical protein [Fibrobacteraceae bacterium]